MPENWFSLSKADQAEALEVAAARSGRPPHLLEKDIWVVWALAAIYNSPLAKTLTFKGGTSLSKVYKIIDRFSEDIDLTYDIRELVPDLLRDGNPIPVSASQEKKISSAVRARLPGWIQAIVQPIVLDALQSTGIQADVNIAGKEHDKLIITYPPVKTGTGYAASTIQLEFGARATGEPNASHDVTCDIAAAFEDLVFPTARPLVMQAERTFWEKATAAHVYCLQGRLRGERYSRHWYDLAAIAKTAYFESAVSNASLAHQVAEHKSMFFSEKDAHGANINYFQAVSGGLQLIPNGDSLAALEKDYSAMLEDGLLSQHRPSFEEILNACHAIQDRSNAQNFDAGSGAVVLS